MALFWGAMKITKSHDEIRRKIRQYLNKTGMTQAAFAREIGKMLTPEKITVTGIPEFLTKKGPVSGNTSTAFYGCYVFFEQMRIRNGNPKTEHLLGMEDTWDGLDFGPTGPGLDTKTVLNVSSILSR